MLQDGTKQLPGIGATIVNLIEMLLIRLPVPGVFAHLGHSEPCRRQSLVRRQPVAGNQYADGRFALTKE